MPPFELQNWDGRLVSQETLAGSTTIVAFTYAKCIFACPMLTFRLHSLDEDIGSPGGVRYLHISINPEADTRDEILLHFSKHDIDAVADPRWLFVNGPRETIDRLLAQTGIEVRRRQVPEGELIDHTIALWVLGPDGTILETFDTYNWNEEAMHHALRFAIHPR